MKTRNITPKEFGCGVGPCPAIFKTDRKSYIIVGRVPVGKELPKKVLKKIGVGEMAIEVPLVLIDKLAP